MIMFCDVHDTKYKPDVASLTNPLKPSDFICTTKFKNKRLHCVHTVYLYICGMILTMKNYYSLTDISPTGVQWNHTASAVKHELNLYLRYRYILV